MYKCVIVDDQTEALDLIRDHVLKMPQLKLIKMTTDPAEALTFINSNKPDIIFLDIEMPGLSGIEFVDNIKAKWGNDIPKIVFTTGYSKYAMEGYEYGVTDYLLKPISFSRFNKCIDRIIDELNKRQIYEKLNFFFVEENGRKSKINFENIVYIEGAGNYIIIASSEAKKIVYKSMNAIQEILPGSKFIRVHKSYIVSVDKVKAIRGNQLIINIKENDKHIPIGITYKENVLKQLGVN
jgi:two-component system, LytTR family, response regulator